MEILKNLKKKKKTKPSYSLMIVSNTPGGDTKQIKVTFKLLMTGLGITAGIAVLVVGLVSGIITIATTTHTRTTALSATVNQLADQNNSLSAENDELNNKVSLLSDTINQKVENENIQQMEIEEKSKPTGFPLTGTASIYYEPGSATDVQEDVEGQDGAQEDIQNAFDLSKPIVIYVAGDNTSIVAAGNGIVSLVGDDTEYGSVVRIDHGNGYVSIYRNSGRPKVAQGDEVMRGALLFELGQTSMFGFQITYEDEYINPMELTEING